TPADPPISLHDALPIGYDRRSPWKLDAREDAAEGRAEDAGHDPRTLSRLWLLVAFNGALIFAAGYTLSQTGDAIAEQTGMTSALVGFALSGLATSTPELATIVTALRLRRPERAFGQVLGTHFVTLALLHLCDALFEGGPIVDELGAFEVVSAL